ncbi:hypothetical protein ACIQWR_29630 [Streptomyces sp. NPDC098789]|uniref:hypothetical protein n=1 Tax=Streptomyces sp. NPDC098789 TaxID=3366098 RepID=UPI00380E12D0
MSRPDPRLWCLWGAVLAVLLGCAAQVPARSPAPAPAPATAFARAADGPVGTRAAADPRVSPERGPSCAPGDPDRGRVPALPLRGPGDHGCTPLARCAPEQVEHARGAPVRAPARGPDRAAPGPLELSVMRV